MSDSNFSVNDDATRECILPEAGGAPAQIGTCRLRSLTEEVEAAYAKCTENSDPTQQTALFDMYAAKNAACISQIVELVQQHPNAPWAFELVRWVAMNIQIQCGARALMPYAYKAIAILKEYHSAHPSLGEVCWLVGLNWDWQHQPTQEFLERVAEINPNRATRGHAVLALARLNQDKASSLAFWEAAPPSFALNAALEKAKTRCFANARGEDATLVRHRVGRLLGTVVQTYADCPTFPTRQMRRPKPSLGEEAGIALFELQHLSLGEVAPEVEGLDLEGHELRLSQYRGNIVLLNFWTSWCGPCLQLVPYECTLVQRMQGRPFALLGVNGDEDLADARQMAKAENMTWRSFWSGESGPNGPIPSAWNIRGWPTVFVLDRKGLIRFKYLGYGGPQTEAFLDEAIALLLKESDTQSCAAHDTPWDDSPGLRVDARSKPQNPEKVLPEPRPVNEGA